ncbi:MAG TPA: GWxTD domain-containing protein [Gemmatimonadaceae bacterium]|nr:GWxTD domain-containing protein [Gemmatimonadaceae bacterium]
MRGKTPSWNVRLPRRAVHSTQLRVLTAAMLLPFVSCMHRAAPEVDPDIASQGRADSLHELVDSRASYHRVGMLVASGDLAFVGSVAFLAGASSDSTLMLVDVSFSDHALTFTREGDSYHAAYDVVLDIEHAGVATRHATTHEDVRVGSVDETTRDGESIIYQQATSLSPGEAVVAISIRDAGSTHAGAVRKSVVVPRFDDGTTTAPIPALRARPRTSRGRMPDLVLNPRSTSVYGRDSIAVFYVESYGPPPAGRSETVQVHVGGDSVLVYADSVPWIEAGDKLRSAILRVPIAKVGFGELSVRAGSQSASQSPLLVSFGDGLPVSTFNDMVGLLRYFASSERLRGLRELAPMDRTRGWAAFVESTDPTTASTENEALKQYFARLADANSRFREDDHTPGWLTDRGMIFSALGEPDNQIQPNAAPADRPEVQVWSYQRYHVRFTFVDRGGSGRWRLTPGSGADYRALMRHIAR